VISMVGGSEERSGFFGGPTAHVDLPAANFSSVGGPRITLAVPGARTQPPQPQKRRSPEPAAGLP
jgi:hypothetical protein